jgi:hypothetical protein
MLLLLDRIQKRATVTYGEIARMLPQQFGLIDAKIFPTHICELGGFIQRWMSTRCMKATSGGVSAQIVEVSGSMGDP